MAEYRRTMGEWYPCSHGHMVTRDDPGDCPTCAVLYAMEKEARYQESLRLEADARRKEQEERARRASVGRNAETGVTGSGGGFSHGSGEAERFARQGKQVLGADPAAALQQARRGLEDDPTHVACRELAIQALHALGLDEDARRELAVTEQIVTDKVTLARVADVALAVGDFGAFLRLTERSGSQATVAQRALALVLHGRLDAARTMVIEALSESQWRATLVLYPGLRPLVPHVEPVLRQREEERVLKLEHEARVRADAEKRAEEARQARREEELRRDEERARRQREAEARAAAEVRSAREKAAARSLEELAARWSPNEDEAWRALRARAVVARSDPGSLSFPGMRMQHRGGNGTDLLASDRTCSIHEVWADPIDRLEAAARLLSEDAAALTLRDEVVTKQRVWRAVLILVLLLAAFVATLFGLKYLGFVL